MNRNLLTGMHGILNRQEAPLSDLRDILYAAFIVIVISVALAGWMR
jgi:hypothetical protein